MRSDPSAERLVQLGGVTPMHAEHAEKDPRRATALASGLTSFVSGAHAL